MNAQQAGALMAAGEFDFKVPNAIAGTTYNARRESNGGWCVRWRAPSGDSGTMDYTDAEVRNALMDERWITSAQNDPVALFERLRDALREENAAILEVDRLRAALRQAERQLEQAGGRRAAAMEAMSEAAQPF